MGGSWMLVVIRGTARGSGGVPGGGGWSHLGVLERCAAFAPIALVLLTALPLPRALFALQTPTTDARAVVPLPIATARAVVTPPRIDGRLTDPVWLEATPVTGFVQRELHEGAP